MLREPRKTQSASARPTQKKSRFQIQKLEERIAPAAMASPEVNRGPVGKAPPPP